MKSLMVAIVAVTMLLVSAMVEASMGTRVRTGSTYGYQVYWVKIVNDTPANRYCTLWATNGAKYSGWIAAYSESGWMQINDITATYRYSCR